MSKRVLIIDDEENLRRMMQLALEAAGYETGEAGDGQKGLALYGDGSTWDAVLLDLLF
jgi:CheY-like chemotaxis protein